VLKVTADLDSSKTYQPFRKDIPVAASLQRAVIHADGDRTALFAAGASFTISGSTTAP